MCVPSPSRYLHRYLRFVYITFLAIFFLHLPLSDAVITYNSTSPHLLTKDYRVFFIYLLFYFTYIVCHFVVFFHCSHPFAGQHPSCPVYYIVILFTTVRRPHGNEFIRIFSYLCFFPLVQSIYSNSNIKQSSSSSLLS